MIPLVQHALISSSESVSFIFLAIMVKNSAINSQPLVEDGNRHYFHTREVDRPIVVGINLVDHVLKLRLAGILSQGSHDSTQLFRGDLS